MCVCACCDCTVHVCCNCLESFHHCSYCTLSSLSFLSLPHFTPFSSSSLPSLSPSSHTSSPPHLLLFSFPHFIPSFPNFLFPLSIFPPLLPSPSLLPPGQLAATEDTDGGGEDIPTSLEVGLLGHVRKVLMLLPDSLVLKVVGHVIEHNCLIAMAYNTDIIVRTAVIRVSEFPLSLFTFRLSALTGVVCMCVWSEELKMIVCDHHSAISVSCTLCHMPSLVSRFSPTNVHLLHNL